MATSTAIGARTAGSASHSICGWPPVTVSSPTTRAIVAAACCSAARARAGSRHVDRGAPLARGAAPVLGLRRRRARRRPYLPPLPRRAPLARHLARRGGRRPGVGAARLRRSRPRARGRAQVPRRGAASRTGWRRRSPPRRRRAGCARRRRSCPSRCIPARRRRRGFNQAARLAAAPGQAHRPAGGRLPARAGLRGIPGGTRPGRAARRSAGSDRAARGAAARREPCSWTT